METAAALILALLATACAALAHLLWGRSWLQIPIFWLAAFAGCIIVYALRLQLPMNLPAPAGVHVLESIIGAWIVLWLASRLRI